MLVIWHVWGIVDAWIFCNVYSRISADSENAEKNLWTVIEIWDKIYFLFLDADLEAAALDLDGVVSIFSIKLKIYCGLQGFTKLLKWK